MGDAAALVELAREVSREPEGWLLSSRMRSPAAQREISAASAAPRMPPSSSRKATEESRRPPFGRARPVPRATTSPTSAWMVAASHRRLGIVRAPPEGTVQRARERRHEAGAARVSGQRARDRALRVVRLRPRGVPPSPLPPAGSVPGRGADGLRHTSGVSWPCSITSGSWRFRDRDARIRRSSAPRDGAPRSRGRGFGSQGHLDIAAVVAVAAAAAIIGDNLGYWVGRTGGRRLLDVTASPTAGSAPCCPGRRGSSNRTAEDDLHRPLLLGVGQRDGRLDGRRLADALGDVFLGRGRRHRLGRRCLGSWPTSSGRQRPACISHDGLIGRFGLVLGGRAVGSHLWRKRLLETPPASRPRRRRSCWRSARARRRRGGRCPPSWHVVVVVLENKDRAAVLGQPGRRLQQLREARPRSRATACAIEPPNHLALVSGSTHGIANDCTHGSSTAAASRTRWRTSAVTRTTSPRRGGADRHSARRRSRRSATSTRGRRCEPPDGEAAQIPRRVRAQAVSLEHLMFYTDC